VVIAISENACDRQVLLDTLDGKTSTPLAEGQAWEPAEIVRPS
jgi:hypothetical protein